MVMKVSAGWQYFLKVSVKMDKEDDDKMIDWLIQCVIKAEYVWLLC